MSQAAKEAWVSSKSDYKKKKESTKALWNFLYVLTNADAFSLQEKDEVEGELAAILNDKQDNTDVVVSLDEVSPITA